MKTISLKYIRYTTGLVLLAGILAFTGCTELLSPQPEDGNKSGGLLTLTIGDAAIGETEARTLYPAQTGFQSYVVSFSHGSLSHDPETFTGLTKTVSLNTHAEPWTVTVTAYTGTEGSGTATAWGTASVIMDGTAQTADITLAPMTGTGTFSYSISFPDTVDTATLNITKSDDSTVIYDVNLKDITPIDGKRAGTLSPTAGYYFMNINLQKGALGAGKTEVVHIYPGLSTAANYTFEDADLRPALDGTASITGGSTPNPKAGETLAAGFTSPDGTDDLSYQWKRGDTAVGTFTDITSGGTYTLTAADKGKYILVEVSRAGYSGSINSPLVSVATDLGLYIGTATSPQPNTGTLALAMSWLKANATNNTNYTILLGADESLPPWTLGGSTAGTTTAANGKTGVTIILKGKDAVRTVQLSGTDSLFAVDTGVTLVLDENITLTGASSDSLVRLNDNGSLVMRENAKITGGGGGVYMYGSGNTFTMNDYASVSNNAGDIGGVSAPGSNNTLIMNGNASISGNTSPNNGGGVRVSGSGSTFTMNDNASVSDNTASSYGGGVSIYGSGITFAMNDNASVSGNMVSSPSSYGGGVYVDNGTFTMSGNALVSDNTGSSSYNSSYGGGVYVGGASGIFSMSGNALVSNNTASCSSGNAYSSYGGGVYVYLGTFTMNASTSVSDNTASSSSFSTVASSGGGVYVDSGTFTMSNNASVSGNTSRSFGGGVRVSGSGSTFTMNDSATVSGNTLSTWAYLYGGGVYVSGAGNTFTMNGGTIYGSDGGINANKLEGSGTKQGVSLYKDSGAMAQYGNGSPIIAGTQTADLYTDDTIPKTALYNIRLDVTGTHTFPAAAPGYGTQLAKGITITNIGQQVTGTLWASLSGTNDTSFTLSTASIPSITAGGIDTFTVRHNNGLLAGLYTAPGTVIGGNGITASFDVSFTVSNYAISLDPSETYTFPAATYILTPVIPYGAQTAKGVTVTNTGNQPTGALTASLSGTDSGSFTLSTTAINSIAVGGFAVNAFTVVPNTGLAGGTYTATVTVSGGNGITASFDVSFTVKTYGIRLDPSGSHIFTPATAGYTAQTAKTMTIVNTGNQPTGSLTIALSGTNSSSFTLSATSKGSIAVGGNSAFTVRPNIGLAGGTYAAIVTVSGSNGITVSTDVSFTVNTYSISLSQTGTYTFPAADPGYGAQAALSVTINNTGTQMTGALTVGLSGTNSGSFTLSTTSISSIAVSGSATDAFTVVPKTGLAAGSYIATVTVTGGNGITASFIVSFGVTPPGLYIGAAPGPYANTGNLASALSWLQNNATSNTNYTILLGTNESLAAYSLHSSTVNNKTDVTITLKGKDAEWTVQLSGTGSLFTVHTGVTLILDENISLKGMSSNNASLIKVDSGGTLELRNGAKISGNNNSSSGGGVYSFGIFTMRGGEITGNTAPSGGGVYSFGTFTMEGGKISGNTASTAIFYNDSSGGGVYSSGTFTMKGGEISGNTASSYSTSSGGGVYSSGTFTMEGGKISGNTISTVTSGASHPWSLGGGVCVDSGTFTMVGGAISGNTASAGTESYSSPLSYGGGVYIGSYATFIMNGGTVYGSGGGTNANKVEGAGTKRGASLFKNNNLTTTKGAWYGNGSPIIAGDQTTQLYTDATLTGHN
jgi:uncharacterized membrane protein